MPYNTGKKAKNQMEIFAAIDKMPVKPLGKGEKSDREFAQEIHKSQRPYPDRHLHGSKNMYRGGGG